MSGIDLSVVVPCYNEGEIIERSVLEIARHLAPLAQGHEIIVVDDGSADDTYARVKSLAARLPQVRGLRFTRNFGKEAAIYAGLAMARGDAVVVMDADLRRPPGMLPEIARLWKTRGTRSSGGEVLDGAASASPGAVADVHRSHVAVRRLEHAPSSDFKLLDRKVVDAYLAPARARTSSSAA